MKCFTRNLNSEMTISSISKYLVFAGCLLLITVGFPSQATDYGEFGGGIDGGSWDGTTATDSTTSNDNDYSYGSDDYGEFGQGASGGQWDGSKEDSVDYTGGGDSSGTSNDGGGWGGQNEDNSSGDNNITSGLSPVGSNDSWADVWPSGDSAVDTPGEFGNNYGDYEAHVDAIQKAIKNTNEIVAAACSGGCSGLTEFVRAETLNQSYYSALNDPSEDYEYKNHSLPKTPDETIDRYWSVTDKGRGIPDHPQFEPFKELVSVRDQAVLDGEIGVIMPGQIANVFPDDYFTPDELEALRKSPYFIDRSPIDPKTGLTKSESMMLEAYTEYYEKKGEKLPDNYPIKVRGVKVGPRAFGGPNGGAVINVARGGLKKTTIQEEGQHLIQSELEQAFGIKADKDTEQLTALKVNSTRPRAEVVGMLEDPVVRDGLEAIARSKAIRNKSIDESTCLTCAETAKASPYIGQYVEAQAKHRVYDKKEDFVDHVDGYLAPSVGAERAKELAEDLFDSESMKRDKKGIDALLRVYSDLNL